MARKKKQAEAKQKLEGFVQVTLSGCSIYGMIGKIIGYVDYNARTVYKVLINEKIYNVRDIFLKPVELEEVEAEAEEVEAEAEAEAQGE